jgi:hypothetical protein
MYQDSIAFKEGRPRTFDELKADLKKASLEITPEMCRNWFKERATDKGYKDFLERHFNIVNKKFIE